MPLRKQLIRLLPQGKQAIINASDFPEEIWNLFTLWKSCPTHHRGLIRFRISDRKFVNHTTEMILWSMILGDAFLFCAHPEGKATEALKVKATPKSERLSPNLVDVPKWTDLHPHQHIFFNPQDASLRLSLYIVSSKGFSLGWPSQ